MVCRTLNCCGKKTMEQRVAPPSPPHPTSRHRDFLSQNLEHRTDAVHTYVYMCPCLKTQDETTESREKRNISSKCELPHNFMCRPCVKVNFDEETKKIGQKNKIRV